MSNIDDHPVLTDTAAWFDEAVPNPTVQQFTTQIGVHFEEVAEMIAEISPNDLNTNKALLDAKVAIQHLADHLKRNPGCVHIEDEKRLAYLDALTDQIVTAVGCAHGAQMDIVGSLHEVNDSNFSKFDENGKAIFDANGKIFKGPNYHQADLTKFI